MGVGNGIALAVGESVGVNGCGVFFDQGVGCVTGRRVVLTCSMCVGEGLGGRRVGMQSSTMPLAVGDVVDV